MTLELIMMSVLVAGIILYTLLGFADFGVGIWEFCSNLRAAPKEKEQLYKAIGPVWEANHVWLIFILVILFSAFPKAFAAATQALWFPLLFALVGIIFRGASFAFRSYATGMVKHESVWGRVFALASTTTPFFFGAAFGTLVSGNLNISSEGEFLGNYFTDWMSPFSMYSAFFFLGTSAYLSAVYLAREAATLLWRRRALSLGLLMGLMALAGLPVLSTEAPLLWKNFQDRSLAFIAFSIFTSLSTLFCLWRLHFWTAVFAAQLSVVSVILGWAFAQYPFIILPTITLQAAKSPDSVLRAMLWGLALGSLLLIPSLSYLFYLFKVKKSSS